MATLTDSSQVIVDLLTTNWNSSNTDSNTPVISKIYEQPKNDMDFDANRDYILIYNPDSFNEEVGIGGTAIENEFNTITIDVRSFGEYSDSGGLVDDTHSLKVKLEIDRILKTNKTNPATGFDLLTSTQNWQELNDRYRGIFRYVKQAELSQYCRDYS